MLIYVEDSAQAQKGDVMAESENAKTVDDLLEEKRQLEEKLAQVNSTIAQAHSCDARLECEQVKAIKDMSIDELKAEETRLENDPVHTTINLLSSKRFNEVTQRHKEVMRAIYLREGILKDMSLDELRAERQRLEAESYEDIKDPFRYSQSSMKLRKELRDLRYQEVREALRLVEGIRYEDKVDKLTVDYGEAIWLTIGSSIVVSPIFIFVAWVMSYFNDTTVTAEFIRGLPVMLLMIVGGGCLHTIHEAYECYKWNHRFDHEHYK